MKFSLQVVEALRNMHPDRRKEIRKHLDLAGAGKRCDVKALHHPLEGWHRLRVGRYRVIFRYENGEFIAEYLAPRNIIYDIFMSMRDVLGPPEKK